MSKERIVLPQIVRQADVGILETADGERITVKAYEKLRVKFDIQENNPEPAVTDYVRTTENEAAAIQYEDGVQLPREPENFPSQNVPGPTHGRLIPNPELAPEGGFVDRDEINRDNGNDTGPSVVTDEDGNVIPDAAASQVEATPGISVVKSGDALPDVAPVNSDTTVVTTPEVAVGIAQETPGTKTTGQSEAAMAKANETVVAPVPAVDKQGNVVPVADEQDPLAGAGPDVPVVDSKAPKTK